MSVSFGYPGTRELGGRILGWRKLLRSSLVLSSFPLDTLLAFEKCVVLPKKTVRFLGFLCDSDLLAFILPDDKKVKCASLRESILSQLGVSIKTLQRLAGKIISFCIAVPAAKLYFREDYRTIAKATHSSRPIKITGDFKAEIECWRS